MKKHLPKDSESTTKSELANMFEGCVDALSLHEFSRVTGVRLGLLRRFITQKTRRARAETWDKIYPTLKPFLTGPEPAEEPAPRIGPAYRRHHDLVEMFSDQKVLLDEFAVLTDEQRKKTTLDFIEAAGSDEPTTHPSLSPDENRLMGAFLKMTPELRNEKLLKLTEIAIAQIRKKRKELF